MAMQCPSSVIWPNVKTCFNGSAAGACASRLIWITTNAPPGAAIGAAASLTADRRCPAPAGPGIGLYLTRGWFWFTLRTGAPLGATQYHHLMLPTRRFFLVQRMSVGIICRTRACSARTDAVDWY